MGFYWVAQENKKLLKIATYLTLPNSILKLAAMERNPLKVLNNTINGTILLRLKDGTEYKGRLQKVDTYMNMVLIDTTEYQEGQAIARYGEIFVRGNNILFIKPDVEP